MYRKIYLSVMIIVLLVLYSIWGVYAEGYDKSWLIDRFNKLDFAINKGEGYSKSTNEDGTLVWSESYLLEGYLDMYEAGRDKSYIEKFVIQAERVLNNTDKVRGIKDYKGRSRIGWSAPRYSKNKEPMVHVGHSGMILYPLVKFSLMVKNNKELYHYHDVADRFTRFTEEAVAEFEGQWKFDRKTGEGNYWFEGDEPIGTDLKAPMPINGPLAIGRVIIILYQLTGKESYSAKAKALAILFKKNLSVMGNGAYVWGYRPDLKKHKQIEDISHGSIDVSFAIEANAARIVFTSDDLRHFAKTIKNASGDDGFATFVDGRKSSKPNEDYSNASGRWLDLCSVDCAIYPPIYNYFIKKYQMTVKEHPAVLLGFAKLVKHYDSCASQKGGMR